MSPLRFLLLSLLAIVFTLTLFSQQNKYSYSDSIFNKYVADVKQKQSAFYILKTNDPDSFTEYDFQIKRHLAPDLFIVKITDTAFLKNKSTSIQKMAPANNEWKLSPSFEEKQGQFFLKNKSILFTIAADNIITLLESWKKKNWPVTITRIHKETNAAVISCSPDYFLKYIVPDTGVFFADICYQAAAEIQLIGYNRSISSINLAQYSLPGVTGNGITIGIKEKKMNDADIDLQKRILPSSITATEQDDHATIIASLAGGAGNSFYTGKGLAWKSKFYPSSYAILFPDDGNLLLQNNVSVQNHSYGTIIQNFYGAEAAAYDIQTAQNKNILHVFSSGNKGQEASTQGLYATISGYATITGNFKMAKNIITVAAIDTGYSITPFSSAGPLYDGRMAPQVAALGPNGTSDAAAIVSGTIALLQQVYKDSNNGLLPPASLIKSILYNTSDDVGNKGIDYRSGFGVVNAFNAIKTINQRHYDGGALAENETWTKNITIPPQAANLKITLCWTDTGSSLNNNKALTNDLDLELTELSTGKIFRPWCLSLFPSADSLQLLPVRKKDSLNTAEQVSIDFPDAGTYQVKITARRVQTINKQDFHIAKSWDTLGAFQFTNPVNANDIDRNENEILNIKWKTAVADTNTTGALYISYNNGAGWKQLTATAKLFKQQFYWAVPDTSTEAMLRMDTPAGSFYSPRFIIAPVTKMNVEFLCADSMQLSWNRHVYAASYQVYTRNDSAYLKPLLVTADTTVTIQRTTATGTVYAVQPILTNSLLATRSAAIDVRNLGVGCFYKTLLAENRGDKIELVVELSTVSQVDSIIFEKITSNGSHANPLARTNAVNRQFVYNCFDTKPFAGKNYYRAAIKLKNGGTVYTEIVSVISNGDHFIFLYPNPLSRNLPLYYQLKTATDGLNLQLLDISGKLIQIRPIGFSGSINYAGLPQGLYIWRLIKNDGILIETGKLIITN
jgi:Subtilase family